MICNFYCGDYKYLYDAVDSEQTKPNTQNKTKTKQEKTIKLNCPTKFSKPNLPTSAGDLFKFCC